MLIFVFDTLSCIVVLENKIIDGHVFEYFDKLEGVVRFTIACTLSLQCEKVYINFASKSFRCCYPKNCPVLFIFSLIVSKVQNMGVFETVHGSLFYTWDCVPSVELRRRHRLVCIPT